MKISWASKHLLLKMLGHGCTGIFSSLQSKLQTFLLPFFGSALALHSPPHRSMHYCVYFYKPELLLGFFLSWIPPALLSHLTKCYTLCQHIRGDGEGLEKSPEGSLHQICLQNKCLEETMVWHSLILFWVWPLVNYMTDYFTITETMTLNSS